MVVECWLSLIEEDDDDDGGDDGGVRWLLDG